MREAAKKLNLKKAKQLRDRIRSLKQRMWPDCFQWTAHDRGSAEPANENNTALRSSSG